MQTVSALQNKRNRTYRSGHGQNFVRVDDEFSRRSITFKIVQYAYLRTNVVRVSKSEEKKEYKLDLTKNTFKLSPKTYKFL